MLLACAFPASASPQNEAPASATDIYYSVRDQTAGSIYAGSLYPTELIETLEKGNSLDRALLLYKRLKEAGHQPELIQGVLRTKWLPEILSAYFATTQEEIQRAMDAGDPMLERISKQLSNHFWVRIPSGESSYLNLDPLLPTSEPGALYGNFRKVLKRLPSDVYQRYELVLNAEFKVGSARARSRLVRVVNSLNESPQTVISLFFVNRNINQEFTLGSGDPIFPVLKVNGEMQPAINLEEEAARIAVRQNLPTPEVSLQKVWLQLIYKSPGSEDVVVNRLIHDAYYPQSSLLKSLTTIFIDNGMTGLSSMASSIGPISGKAAAIDADWKPAFLSVFTDEEKAEVADRATGALALGQSILGTYVKSLSGIPAALSSAESADFKSAAVTPRIIACYVSPGLKTVELDVLLNEYNYYSFSKPRSHSLAFNMLCGALSSGLEGGIMRKMLEGDHQPSVETALSMSLAAPDGIQWVCLSRETRQRLSAMHLSEQGGRSITNSLLSGHIVLAPAVEAPRFWWDLNPVNGSIRGVIEPGYGGARYTYSLRQQDRDHAESYHLASTDEGWGQALKTMLQRLEGRRDLDFAGFGESYSRHHLSESRFILDSLLEKMAVETSLREFPSREIRKGLTSIVESGLIAADSLPRVDQ
jgi:hypothetical protein